MHRHELFELFGVDQEDEFLTFYNYTINKAYDYYDDEHYRISDEMYMIDGLCEWINKEP